VIKGWEIKNLGEVSEILNGGTPKSKVKEYWNGNQSIQSKAIA